MAHLKSSGLTFLLIAVGGLMASCSGSNSDTAQQADMKKGFTSRPPIDQLPPAQKARAEAMKDMAESMAKNGPSGAAPVTH